MHIMKGKKVVDDKNYNYMPLSHAMANSLNSIICVFCTWAIKRTDKNISAEIST